MKGLTPELVAGVAEEIDALKGWRVHAVHQDARDRFRVTLRDGSDRIDLHVVLEHGLPYAALRPPARAPREPTPLANAMRGLLRGARIAGADAVPGERALAVVFEHGTGTHTLWVELFGHQANLYFLDPDGLVALTPRGDVAKRRGASRGAAFEPVPAREGAPAADDASARIAAMRADAGGTATLDSARTAARRTLKRLAKRAQGRLREFEAMQRRAADAPEHRRRGELLQGSFHLLAPGLRSVRVPDYTTDPPTEVDIEVDPNLSPGEQVAACFRRERKCRRAGEEAERRLPEQRAVLAAIEGARTAVEQADSPEAVAAALESAGAGPSGAASKQPRTQQRRAWRTFVSSDGWRILVGKNARANDELTLKKARPQDLFLHVRGASGSHIIVPKDRGKSVPKETLLDAAELACHFSERRAAERNEVDYVEKRHVRKPKGSPPGRVAVERAKTLALRRDDDRRARLLASAMSPDGT